MNVPNAKTPSGCIQTGAEKGVEIEEGRAGIMRKRAVKLERCGKDEKMECQGKRDAPAELVQAPRPSRMVALQSLRTSVREFGARPTIGFRMRVLGFQRTQRFRDLHQDFAKPDASRVRMAARGMKEVFVKGADVQRNSDRVDIEDSCVRTDEAFGNYRDEIGLRDYVQSLQVVRNG